MKKILFTLSFLVFVSGCASDQPSRMAVDFGPTQKINLDVQTIDFADRSNMQTSGSLYTTNNFKPTIVEAVRQWAASTLQAAGLPNSGRASVIVKDASLTPQPLPHSDSWFTREQTIKYVARAEVEIDANGRGAYAMASAEATRFETLPENPTEIEKQNAYAAVLNGLMHDLQQNLQTSINEHMSRFVITAPILK